MLALYLLLFHKMITTTLCIGLLMSLGALAKSNIFQFFQLAPGNLTKITWAHAVNSRKLLEEALKGPVMMLEADIILGHLVNTTTTDVIPIMGHPPATTSDLSLECFLEEILNFNNIATTEHKKGAKLDFKTIEALEQSNVVLRTMYTKVDFPFWLNADILHGPGNPSALPVDPIRFFRIAKQYENSTLSIGWTTAHDRGSSDSYTDSQINSMLEEIQKNDVKQSITFPVRAAIAAESERQMLQLLKAIPDSTLTIWSGEETVNVEKLRRVIETAGLNNVYLDVPNDLRAKLHLDSLKSKTTS